MSQPYRPPRPVTGKALLFALLLKVITINYVIKLCIMKAYGGKELHLRHFDLDTQGGEWSFSPPCHFTSGDIALVPFGLLAGWAP
jgi:hypothetical protein